jgi:predicted glutamine amidotransferase
MCRLLYVRNKTDFKISNHLKKFAEIAKNSKEYQGHGWGCAYLEKDHWKHYKNISPIWNDDLDQFGTSTLLIAHVRSAFRDKDIAVENNMPFYDDKYVFIFNGELHGVKIKADGRIGAEKIFNFIKRFDKGDMLKALSKGVDIISKQSRYIRAMNIIITDKQKAFVSTQFNEDHTYFTLHYKQSDNELILCSEPYSQENNWGTLKNNTKKLL